MLPFGGMLARIDFCRLPPEVLTSVGQAEELPLVPIIGSVLTLQHLGLPPRSQTCSVSRSPEPQPGTILPLPALGAFGSIRLETFLVVTTGATVLWTIMDI